MPAASHIGNAVEFWRAQDGLITQAFPAKNVAADPYHIQVSLSCVINTAITLEFVRIPFLFVISLFPALVLVRGSWFSLGNWSGFTPTK